VAEEITVAKGIIAGRKPIVVALEPGTYDWCACGRSKGQPYCDGSHQGTAFTPVAFEIKTAQKVALCTCKQTDTPPRCDGSHLRLPE
jgi:CDGSH-type Zn-finger protein